MINYPSFDQINYQKPYRSIMKRRLLLALFFVFPFVSFHNGVEDVPLRENQSLVRAEDIQIKILTYNVLGGRNTDGSKNLDRLADVISALDPDIVALQEVDRNTGRLDGLDLPAELAQRTGMVSAFGRAMYYDGGEYGEAVLSRFPISDVTNHALPHLEASEPRAALAVTVEIPNTDLSFVFIATHLDHQRSPEDRIAQAGEINKILALYEGQSVILAGDLNATPESETMKILYSNLSDSWPEEKDGSTFSSENPRRRIDYILYRSPDQWTVVNQYRGIDVRTDDEEWMELLRLASDHLPLMAEMSLRME